MMKETRSLLFLGLLPCSPSLSFSCLPTPLPFYSLLTKNNIGSDLTDTETHWGARHLKKGQYHGLCAMQAEPSHGDSLQWHRGTRLGGPSHLERLFWRQRQTANITNKVSSYQRQSDLKKPAQPLPREARQVLGGQGRTWWHLTALSHSLRLGAPCHSFPHLSNPVDNNPHLGA